MELDSSESSFAIPQSESSTSFTTKATSFESRSRTSSLRSAHSSATSTVGKSNVGKAVNLSVLCPTCSTSIAVDLPFLMITEGEDASRESEEEHTSEESESDRSMSFGREAVDGDADDEQLESMKRYQRRQRRKEVRRQRYLAKKDLVKELQKKVDELTVQLSNSCKC